MEVTSKSLGKWKPLRLRASKQEEERESGEREKREQSENSRDSEWKKRRLKTERSNGDQKGLDIKDHGIRSQRRKGNKIPQKDEKVDERKAESQMESVFIGQGYCDSRSDLEWDWRQSHERLIKDIMSNNNRHAQR